MPGRTTQTNTKPQYINWTAKNKHHSQCLKHWCRSFAYKLNASSVAWIHIRSLFSNIVGANCWRFVLSDIWMQIWHKHIFFAVRRRKPNKTAIEGNALEKCCGNLLYLNSDISSSSKYNVDGWGTIRLYDFCIFYMLIFLCLKMPL